MINEEKIYKPKDDEDISDFVHRVIAEQENREPLHIVEQLVEIALGEMKDRPYDVNIYVTEVRMKVTLNHKGRPIDSRMVWVMGDHTDRVDYHSDGTKDGWILTIRRDIPPLFVTKR